MPKAIINEEELNEFKSSDRQSTTADPVDAGGSAHRSADKDGGESSYSATTKSEVLSAIMNNISGLSKDELSDIFKGLGVSGENNKRSADKSGSEGQLRLSPTSAPANASAPPAGDTGGSATGQGERSQIRTSPTSAGGGKAYKEDVEEIFAGDELSEDLKNKASVVFEAAINARLVSEVARIEEEFDNLLEEAIDVAYEELVESVDKYLSTAVVAWLEENALQVETGLKVEMAEDFMRGLKGLFEENYVSIPDDQVDVVSEMTQHIEDLESTINSQIEKNYELAEQIENLKIENIFHSVSEGLASTQVEKLRTLSEGIAYDSVDEYASKIDIIKETYFSTNPKTPKVSTLNEEVEYSDEPEAPRVTGAMAAYITQASKLASKN
jgi:hypothetical protein